MSRSSNNPLLAALLDSWDRSNAILVNLLRALPEGSLDIRATKDSPTISELFMHIHYVRLVFVSEDAPEFAVEVPKDEWASEHDPDLLERHLNESAQVVRDAVQGRIESGKPMDQHYDHPMLFLQHMIWHEGYHHGQIKLALKAADMPFDDEAIGPVTWSIWMKKTALTAQP